MSPLCPALPAASPLPPHAAFPSALMFPSQSQAERLFPILLNVKVMTFAVYGPLETELNVLAQSPNK